MHRGAEQLGQNDAGENVHLRRPVLAVPGAPMTDGSLDDPDAVGNIPLPPYVRVEKKRPAVELATFSWTCRCEKRNYAHWDSCAACGSRKP